MSTSSNGTNYFRWLDMDQALVRTTWNVGSAGFSRWVFYSDRDKQISDALCSTTFCSNPAHACVQYLNSTQTLPSVTYALDAAIAGLPQPIVTCLDSSTLYLRGNVSNPGMAYELLGRVTVEGSQAKAVCSPVGSNNATITVTGATGSRITWVGDTEYDMDAGDSAHGYSFKGQLPHDQLVSYLGSASSSSFNSLLSAHVQSYNSFLGGFQLNLGQTPDLNTPTDQLKAAYKTDTGNPYVEWLLFNFGRYLLTGSAPGALPANLQGKWGRDLSNPWGAGGSKIDLSVVT